VQQHVGETTGGRSRVQAAPARHGWAPGEEAVQRAEKLPGAPRYPIGFIRLRPNQQRSVRVDSSGRLGGSHPTDPNPALLDELGGVVAGSSQTTAHQLRIQPGPAPHPPSH
jgi:hypothetical protein